MIIYLLKSALCLSVLLALYYLFLERERMHRFNRFFLLACLLTGLAAPIIRLNGPVYTRMQQPLYRVLPAQEKISLLQDGVGRQYKNSQPQVAGQPPFPYTTMLAVLYLAGLAAVLSRFGYNLAAIFRKVLHNSHETAESATFILLDEEVVPHSFGNYIFLNKQAYRNGEIGSQVILHELAHVRQRHTADILLIELLRCVFWFNPVFTLYKRALQLNHEFLADAAVLGNSPDIRAYQYLLLKASGLKPNRLASYLNYSLTIKRFKMMKKHTSNRKIVARTGFLVPAILILAVVFSNRGIAQKTGISPIKTGQEKTKLSPNLILFWHEPGVNKEKRFSEMTPTERSYFQPTQAQLNDWKNPEKFILYVDNSPVANKDLNNYAPSDFLLFQSYKKTMDQQTRIHLTSEKFFEAPEQKKRHVIATSKAYFGVSDNAEFAKKLTPTFVEKDAVSQKLRIP